MKKLLEKYIILIQSQVGDEKQRSKYLKLLEAFLAKELQNERKKIKIGKSKIKILSKDLEILFINYKKFQLMKRNKENKLKVK
ncbi:unnamed protein product [Paramecium sonneborni]|uniref:Uncharacterized protein n=1 Tax=Paramecium sonneborni TaxID=65129 RepID=A0A8S1M599_9CILI|nr:unnamed protein product [Paramecium sonneborni]